jgi:hypothetical protein
LRHLNENELDIYGPSIPMGFNNQPPHLKKELLNHLVDLFGDVFNQSKILSMVSNYLKYVRDTYRVNLEDNPKYECPLIIPKREWRDLIEVVKENKMRKEGKTLPNGGR